MVGILGRLTIRLAILAAPALAVAIASSRQKKQRRAKLEETRKRR